MRTIQTVLSTLKGSTETIILNLDDIDFSKETSDDLDLLAKWIATNKKLTQIYLRRTKLSLTRASNLKGFFDAIQQHPRLSSLTLTDAIPRIEDAALIQNFASCLAKSKIRELILDHNQLNEQFLAMIISENKNLKSLSINSIGLGCWDESAIRVLCNAMVNSNLESLFMSQNGLGKLDCLLILGEAISSNRALTTLSVSDNDIGKNKNAEAFIIKTAGLKYLDISHNSLVNIGREGWESFVSTVISNPQMVNLDISSNNIGSMEMSLLRQGRLFSLYLNKLKEALPELELDYSDNDIIEGICLIEATLSTVEHLPQEEKARLIEPLIGVTLSTVEHLPLEEKARLRPNFERAFRGTTPPPSQFFVPV